MQTKGPTTPRGAHAEPPPPASTLAAELTPLDGFTVVGVLGAELASPVATMQTVVQEFISTRKISSTQMQRLVDAIETTRKLALASQQMSRVASGKLRQSHERLSLNGMLKELLGDRQRHLVKRGIDVDQQLQTVDVMLDPGLLSSLLDAALDWAVAHGNRIQIALGIMSWPQNGLLSFKVSQQLPAAAARSDAGISDVHLQLLLLLTQSMELKLTVSEEGGYQILRIEFPRTVKNIQSQLARADDNPKPRMDRASSQPPSVFIGSTFSPSAMPGESRFPSAHQLLLISTDPAVSADVKLVCRNLRVTVDTVPNAQSAERFCSLARPVLVLVDEAQMNAQFQQFKAVLKAEQPNFPIVEIASAGSYLSVLSWMDESIMRIGRESLRDQLPGMLSQEIQKLDLPG